jgi:large subunit ribosomal protein L3
MGDRRRTQQNLEKVRTDADRGLLFVKGSVPGSKNGWLLVRDAVKLPLPDGVPFPGAVIDKFAAAPVQDETPTTPVEAIDDAVNTTETPAADTGSDENKEG